MLEHAWNPAAKTLLLNFPTNPTGAALSPADAAEIAAFTRKHDLLVITDEIYSELTYGVPRASVATQPGMKERTIFLGGFSKAWAMTGFRVGFACAPAPLVEAMMKIHQYTMLCAPILSQIAAVEALRSGMPDMSAMCESYEKRRNYIVAALNEIGLPCGMPDGAFYVFPSIRRFGLSSREFALRLLDEEKVACVPGSAFGASGEGFLRCAYATSLDDMKEAVRRIASFVKRLPASA
jgi:aminotransferase